MNKLIFTILKIPAVNWIIKIFSPILRSTLPSNIYKRIPIVGKIPVNVLEFDKSFSLVSDGRDPLTSRFYWLGHGSFEPETFHVFAHLLNNSKVFCDIGANVGVYSLFAAANNPELKIYSFEPNPEINLFLKRNIEYNNFNKIEAYDIALSNYNGKIKFYVRKGNTLSLSGSTRKGFRNTNDLFEVKTKTLDSFFKDNTLESLDVIKIDTEGTEDVVFQGAENVLKNFRPIVICEVLHGRNEKGLSKIFDQLDYNYYHIADKLFKIETLVGDKDHKYRNFLIVPKEKKILLANFIE